MLEEHDHEDRVLKLEPEEVALRQAGRRWYAKLSEALRDFELIQFTYDLCLFYLGRGEDSLIITIWTDVQIVWMWTTSSVKEISKHF